MHTDCRPTSRLSLINGLYRHVDMSVNVLHKREEVEGSSKQKETKNRSNNQKRRMASRATAETEKEDV